MFLCLGSVYSTLFGVYIIKLRAATWGRPYENAETCPVNAVGAGPRPARGRTLCAPTYFQKRQAGLEPALTKDKTVSGMPQGPDTGRPDHKWDAV